MRHSLVLVLLFAAASPPAPLFATTGGETDAALNCVILPDEQVEVSSPVPGVLETVLVRRSDRVERGQVLARLESSVEEATVALARERARTDAEIRLRRIELGYDTQHRDRLQALHLRNATSEQSREDAERVAEAARLRVRLAEDRRREVTLERRRADAVLALKTVRSPIEGVIVQRHKTVGEYVEDQPIVRIARLDPLRVEVIAPLALFGAVHAGMQVAVRPETDPDRERIATVTAVDAVADPGSGTFGVQLELPNPGLALPAGIKCKGRLLSRVADTAAGPAPAERVVADDSPRPTPDETARAAGATAEEEAREVTAAPFAVRAAAVDVPGACLALEALDDEEQAYAVARAAERLGARAAISETSASRVFGYVVLTPPEPRSEARRQLVARFQRAGITDLLVIERGAYTGRISLGAYNGPQSAEKRRAALAELGFDTDVQPRTRTQPAWRVELRFPTGIELASARAALVGEAGRTTPKPAQCDSLQAAAR